MPKFYMILAPKIIKIPEFLLYLPTINKIPDFCPKMPEFYIIIARKYFSDFFARTRAPLNRLH